MDLTLELDGGIDGVEGTEESFLLAGLCTEALE